MDGVRGIRTKAGWLLLTTALSSVVALDVTGQMPFQYTMPPPPPARTLSEQPVIRELRPHVLEGIDDMLDRPLFAMTRRPALLPNSEASYPVRPGWASDTLKLVGIILTGKTRLALFRHPERGTLRRQQGQEIEGWKIAEIDQERVHLQRGAEEEWLALNKRHAKRTKTSEPLVLSDAASADQIDVLSHAVD